MSDRLWLGQTAQDWADVNRSEHPSVLSAILALQGMPGPRKVIGTAAQIAECQRIWRAAFATYKADPSEHDSPVYRDPDDPESVSWRVVLEGEAD
jgi:hypothetical protein